MYWSFLKFPSWALYLKPSEIISVYAYAFLVDFLESILLLILTLIASVVFSQKLWKESFVSKGLLLISMLFLSAQVHMYIYRNPDDQAVFLRSQAVWWIGTLLLVIIIMWLTNQAGAVDRILVDVADRLIVFTYIYLPLTVVALVVVLARIML